MSVYSRDSLEASTYTRLPKGPDDNSSHAGSTHSNRISLNLSDLVSDPHSTEHKSSLSESYLNRANVHFAENPGDRGNKRGISERTVSVSSDSLSYDHGSATHLLSPSQKLISNANQSLQNHRSLDLGSFGLQFPTNGNQTDKLDYKKELTKLLAKSKGTAYENTLRRFVEKKLKEIDRDQETAEQNPFLCNQPERDLVSSFQSQGSKMSLMSLTSSKYDDPRLGSSFSPIRKSGEKLHTSMDTGFFSQLSEHSVSKETAKARIDEMARPLDRNRYKGPEDPLKRVTTNHLGRQRPPPKDLPIHSSPYHIHKTMFSPTRAHHHSKSFQEKRLQQQADDDTLTDDGEPEQFVEINSRFRFSSPMKKKVSVKDFRQWLRRNQEWEQKHKQKVSRTKDLIDAQIDQAAQPRLFSKSVKLAEIAQMKESAQLREINNLLTGQSLSGHITEESSRKIRVVAPDEVLSHRWSSQSLDEPEVLSVYDRLAIRGRIHADKKRNAVPAPRSESFSPAILDRSVRLAERRRSRQSESMESRSESGSRLKRSHSAASVLIDYNALPYRKDSPESKRERRRVVNSRRHYLEEKDRLMQSQSEPTSPDQLRSVGGAAEHSQHNSSPAPQTDEEEQENIPYHLHNSGPAPAPARSASPSLSHHAHQHSRLGSGRSVASARTVNLTEAVKYDLSRSRSRSRSREVKQMEKKLQTSYGHKHIPAAKLFQPTIIASETNRIMSKVKSSFEERNIKAIENQLIRKVISSRSPSPGPGHYFGLSTASAQRSSLSTASTHRQPEEKSPSRGYRGFSFGKEKPPSSVTGMTYDPQGRPSQSVYEFKSPVLESRRNSQNESLSHSNRSSMLLYGGGSNNNNNNSNSPLPLQRVNSMNSTRSGPSAH